MRKFFGAVLLAAVNVGPAMAADLPFMPERPGPSLVFSWTGWYVGGFVGAALGGDAHTSHPIANEVVHYSTSSSVLGGVTAGYNYQIPGSAIIFGLETEFGALSLKGSSSFVAGDFAASATTGPWYNATALRIGWAWDRLMFYGKGGFALSTIETTLTDTRGFLGEATGKRDVIGWAWGAGLEYVFWSKWSVKAEYLWLGLNHSVGVCETATFCSNTSTQAVQTAKIGVNYLLNVGPVYSRY
jgi:outer membrane immunogenic protein